MDDRLSRKQAIEFLRITSTRFYKLKEAGLIPDGVAIKEKKMKYWRKSQLTLIVDKIDAAQYKTQVKPAFVVVKPDYSPAYRSAFEALNKAVNK